MEFYRKEKTMRTAMSEEDLKWRRRSDARTLAEAEQIKADKERYNGAVIGAREIAQEEIERVKGIAKVAGMKTPQAPKTEPQSTPQHLYGQRVIPNTVVTPQFSPRRSNPATIGRL